MESFHRIVEDEFYDIERYRSSDEFLGKAWAYQICFNYFRKNRWRDNKAPADILREKDPRSDPGVLDLPPIRLETLLDNYYPTGYHVPKPALKIAEWACKIVGTLLLFIWGVPGNMPLQRMHDPVDERRKHV